MSALPNNMFSQFWFWHPFKQIFLKSMGSLKFSIYEFEKRIQPVVDDIEIKNCNEPLKGMNIILFKSC